MHNDIIPQNTRYVPILQQPYCCGPACLTMVMIRNGIPPLPQELLGYHMGLVVPEAQKGAFWQVRTASSPVAGSGFGTQVQNEGYGLSKVLRDLAIPLDFTYIAADSIDSVAHLEKRVEQIIRSDGDVLVCLNWAALTGQAEKNWGHILCVDQIEGSDFRLVDTDVGAKWKSFSASRIYDAIRTHGNANYGGLLVFRKAQTEGPEGLYRHYKGKMYKLLSISKHSETLEEHVVYQALYGAHEIWVRPKTMFFETVCVDGIARPRFERIP